MEPRHEEMTCTRCGWVHVTASRAEITGWLREGDTLESFARCRGCGGSHKNFRPSKLHDAPAGCTIGPILNPAEDL